MAPDLGRYGELVRGTWKYRRLLATLAAGLEHYGPTEFLARLSRDDQRRIAVALLKPDGVVIDFERDGLRWRVDTGDEIGEQLYTTGSYEAAEIAAVLGWLPRATGTVVDLGANVGTTTIPFALAGYEVVAIEPIVATYSMLVENVTRNAVADRVRCINAAVVDEPGPVRMYTGTGSGQAEVAVAGRDPAMLRWGGQGDEVVVDGIRLEDVGLVPAGVALVWADVQGSEASVIQTGAFLWEAGVPLYLEVDPTSLDLHGGVRHFVELVERHFGSYLSRTALLRGEPAEPIASFGPWVGTIRSHSYSDALLVPRDPAPTGTGA